MNFQFYVENLKEFRSYKEFMKKNPDAFPCSGFFIIDKQGMDEQQHFDFYIPKDKKMVSFKLEDNCELEPLEFVEEKVLEKLDLNLDFDFKKIEKMIEKRKEEEGIKSEIQKYLFSLQNSETGHILVGTVFISMLGMLHVKIDLDKMEITLFEKKSFFDIMKVRRGKD